MILEMIAFKLKRMIFLYCYLIFLKNLSNRVILKIELITINRTHVPQSKCKSHF